jgi:xanthine dehydrogenase accessory factor
MDSVDLDVIRTGLRWIGEGRRVTLATIVRTWGSAPRPVGAMTVIRDDGQIAGSVSGGCVEDDLVDRVRAGTVAPVRPELVVYGVSKEQAERFGLPCGGTLEIVCETLTARSGLEDVLAAIERNELVLRRLDMDTGGVEVLPGKWADALQFDGRLLVSVHGPRWRLLLIGAGQLSRYLAQFAQALDYHVTVCDPREEYANEWNVPGADLTRGMPDDVVNGMNMDAHSAVIALTHDPKLDDLALIEALKSPAFYVGALGSRINNERRRLRLREFDLSEDEIGRLHGPVGLRIGSRTPPEIAISILSEMTAVRYGVTPDKYADKSQPSAASPKVDDPLACGA